MSEQVAQGIADDKLDELADLLAHWQRNRAKGVTPRAVRAAIFMSLDETQLVSSLRTQVATLTEKVERLRKENDVLHSHFEDECGECSVVTDRDRYKTALERISENYKPGNMGLLSLIGKTAYDALAEAVQS